MNELLLCKQELFLLTLNAPLCENFTCAHKGVGLPMLTSPESGNTVHRMITKQKYNETWTALAIYSTCIMSSVLKEDTFTYRVDWSMNEVWISKYVVVHCTPGPGEFSFSLPAPFLRHVSINSRGPVRHETRQLVNMTRPADDLSPYSPVTQLRS